MDNYNIYLDESGWADTKTWERSQYFIICGFVMNARHRKKFKVAIEKLKIKYFNKKSYILHSVDLKRDLHNKGKSLNEFAKDLGKILNLHYFFLLYVCVNKEKAHKREWTGNYIHEKAYRIILGNLLKFLVAKDYRGNVFAEASAVQQDISIYKSFFHFIANGIKSLSITPVLAKKHLTSLSFVTKLNNDVEEQMADLFSYCGKLRMLVEKESLEIETMDPLDAVLYKVMQERLFIRGSARLPKKKILYKAINSFKKLP